MFSKQVPRFKIVQNRKKYLKAQQNYKHHFSLWQELDASQVLIVEHRTNGAQQIDHQGGHHFTFQKQTESSYTTDPKSEVLQNQKVE